MKKLWFKEVELYSCEWQNQGLEFRFDIRAKLLHGSLFCLPVLDHTTSPRKFYIHIYLAQKPVVFLLHHLSSHPGPPTMLVAGIHWAHGSHSMPSNLRRGWWYSWWHPFLWITPPRKEENMVGEIQAYLQVASWSGRSKVNNRSNFQERTQALSWWKSSATCRHFTLVMAPKEKEGWMSLGKRNWRKMGFCFTLIPNDPKSNATFLEKRWSLQNSVRSGSIQLRPLM